MTKHLVTSALLAGFIVACLATVLQFGFLERNIVLAERYESGALTHFAGVQQPDGAVHDHTDAAHDHPTDAQPFWARQGKTLLTMIITYCGYALMMVAGLSLARHFGKTVGTAQAMLWGLAGFAAFSLAPAMGLEPTLPGVEGADLAVRQVWWLFCAGATVAGLGLLAYGNAWARFAGPILLLIPHIIGAPHLAEFTGILPPEMAAQHAARSLGVGLVAWVTLGGLSRWFLDRNA
ncbi:MAG: CbtA family protein [Candidatus Saccharibacteria bacterium]|nr:CbtA family protein [Pseudorhodobacter sp.]